jgi:O-antigen/teichoic acid export membrane protein
VLQVIRVHNVALLLLALLFSALARPLLTLLVGPGFQDAAPFVLLLSLGAAAGGMYNMAVNPLFYANKTYLVPIATVGSGLTNLVLNYFLISALGPIGAALSFAVSSLVCYLLTLVVARDVLPPPKDAEFLSSANPRTI